VDVVNNKHYWSDEVYNIFGISKQKTKKVSSDLFLSFIHPKDFEVAKEVTEGVFQNPASAPMSFDFRFIRSDGVLRYGHLEKNAYLMRIIN